MRALRQQLRALLLAFRQLGGHPVATLFTALAMGVAISLPAGLYLVLSNLERLAGDVPAQPEISLYLSSDIDTAARDALAARLQGHAALASRRYVSRDAALQALGRSHQIGDLTAGLAQNPLPDAWILRPRQTTAAALAALESEFENQPGVAHVAVDSAWAERLQAALSIGRMSVWLLAGMFGVALLAISGNAIRTLILARREEIEVSRLIGATDRYVRRPFLYLGALQGLLGGLAAAGLLALAGVLLQAPVLRLAQLYGSSYRLLPPTPEEIALLLGVTALLGYAGAWLTVARTLRRVE